jgi:rhodanese-related sulfurtransferase
VIGPRVPAVDVREAHRRLTDPAVPAAARPLLVDVREPKEFAAVRAAGAALLPISRFLAGFRALPRDRELLLICRSGNRSHDAARFLLDQGWTDVVNVAGGTIDWQRAGLPLRSGPPEPGEGALP